MKILWRSVPLMFAGACRLLGPSGDSSAYVEIPTDAAARDGTSSEVESGGNDEPELEASADEVTASEPSVDAAIGDAAIEDAAESGAASDRACTPPSSVPTCNPLKNTGCFLPQCDVDTTMSTPTGVCVLAAAALGDAGATCTKTSGSVACNPGLTCFGGSCRKVCFCDGDCGNSECCTDDDGATGFKLCAACH